MKIKQAFTLVELIVVITILAILGTIGFINLQGFSSSSRDSKRISELTEIRSGLQIYQARNSLLPTPSEQSVTIGSGTTTLIIQGYAGISVLNEIRMNGEVKDPLDEDKYYTYSVNASKTKFQLLSLLENTDNSVALSKINLIQTANASYENRYPYIVGNIVGIFLDETTNTPIQELVTSIDLNTDINNYKVVFSDETLTGSGTELYNEIFIKTNNNGIVQTEEPQLLSWRELDINCEIEDITIGDQIWAGCNSTLGDGFEWGQIDDNIGTSSYSGTIASCYPSYEGTINTSEPTCQPGHTKMASNSKANDWFNGTNLNNDSEYNTIWGKLYTWDNSSSACPIGRKVPSDADWEILETHLNGLTNCRNATDGWLCDGLGWNGHSNGSKDDTNNLANALILPLAGLRNDNSTTFGYRGRSTSLWSSAIDDSNAFRRAIHWNNFTVLRDTLIKDYGLSVRCLKN